MNHRTPGLLVHHQLPEFMQTHVHWVSDDIQPSHPLLSPSLPVLNLSQHQGLLKWVNSSNQVAKALEFQLQHQSSNEHSGLISFRMDWLDLLAVQGTLKSSPTPQFKSINSSVLSFLYSPTLTSIMPTGKTIALTRWTFFGKVMSLLLNMLSAAVAAKLLQSSPTLWDPMDYSLPGSSIHGIFQARVLEWGAIAFSDTLSRLVIAFLPRSKRLLTSWLQSPSAVSRQK